jgi:hypothetical protein
MTEIDPHRQRIIIDSAEWQHRLKQLAEMRRAADEAPSATVSDVTGLTVASGRSCPG